MGCALQTTHVSKGKKDQRDVKMTLGWDPRHPRAQKDKHSTWTSSKLTHRSGAGRDVGLQHDSGSVRKTEGEVCSVRSPTGHETISAIQIPLQQLGGHPRTSLEIQKDLHGALCCGRQVLGSLTGA